MLLIKTCRMTSSGRLSGRSRNLIIGVREQLFLILETIAL